MFVVIGGGPLGRHDGHDRFIGARRVGPRGDQPHALEHAPMVRIEHHGLAVERGGIDHARRDFAPDSGQLLQPCHRPIGLHRFEMRQIDRATPCDQIGETRLQPFSRDVGIGLGGEIILQFLKRSLGHRLPTPVLRQQPVGRRVGDFGARACADHPLHQHPFGRPAFPRRAFDPPEPLDQPRLELAQRFGARIVAKGKLHRPGIGLRSRGRQAPARSMLSRPEPSWRRSCGR